jgi:glycosyltransferase involved in cell wall biosynthesis
MSTSSMREGSMPEASMPNTPSVTLVIPAKDEARNVAWVLRRLPVGIDEVILVDGHSTDDTVEVARAVCPEVIVVEEQAPGKGAAMRTGMELASSEVIVLIDADGSMDPRELYRYVEASAECDLVKGSRFAERGGSDDISVVRRIGNRLLLGLVNVLYGSQLTDLCYGYCAVRRSALPALALCSDGFEIETEMTARALRAGLRIGEVPSFEAPRRYGESHLRTVRDGWRVLRTLLVERFRPQPTVELPVAAAVAAAGSSVPLGAAPAASVVDAALTISSLAQD